MLTLCTSSIGMVPVQEPVAASGFLQHADYNAPVTLPRILGDGMVLQRDHTIPVWGRTHPGAAVRVSFAGTVQYTLADHNGNWNVSFQPMRAGGPYVLKVNDKVVNDILIGDVWLFSGQSNIELQVRRVAIRYPVEASTYTNTQIREFRTTTHYDFHGPLWDVPEGRWKKCVQEEIPEFSALAFFFGMEWNQRHNVPVGLIVNGVGGSPLDAWLDEATLRGLPGPTGPDYYPKQLTALKRDTWVDSVKQAETEAMVYYRSLFTSDPGPEGSLGWTPYRVPSFWNQEDATPHGPLSRLPGSAWFKKVFYLTGEQIRHAQAGAPDRDGMLILGTMTDADMTFLNGRQVGSTGYQYPPRIYTIPKGLLKAGSNELLVRLENFWGPGGFTSGKGYALYIGAVHPFYYKADTVSLEGDDWLARMAGTLTDANAPYPATTTWHYQPAGLYNALLAPLTQFPIKGVIWYQGESQTQRRDYDQMLCALMDRWRNDWNDRALPFVIVQLPNYMKDIGPWPVETDWARRRSEQFMAARARKYTALVVTHDIGEWNDVHPLNKKDLAQRVVSAAEYLGVGNRKAPLSPVPQQVALKGSRVVITFSHTGKGLKTINGLDPSHFALANEQGRYFRAHARIIGKKKVEVWCVENFTPRAVRYAWANDPSEANLQNDAGLPAPTFQWNLNDRK